MLAQIDDNNLPGQGSNVESENSDLGVSFILHCTEPGQKTKEFNLLNKMHYFGGTNEFLRYLAVAEYKPNLRTLKAFL